jgi:hypothetical protein
MCTPHNVVIMFEFLPCYVVFRVTYNNGCVVLEAMSCHVVLVDIGFIVMSHCCKYTEPNNYVHAMQLFCMH